MLIPADVMSFYAPSCFLPSISFKPAGEKVGEI